MFDPLTGAVMFLGWQLLKKQQNSQFGVLTPERDEMFRNALEHLSDPARLRKLADAFENEGFKAQANVLRRRAVWRERDADTKAAHESVFQKALESKNIQAILNVANAFEAMTATNKANQLREHAKVLQSAQSAPAEKPAPPADRKAPEPANSGFQPVQTTAKVINTTHENVS